MLIFCIALITCGLVSFPHGARAQGPIKVGLLQSTTGTMAISEKPLVDAALMAIDEINRAGGVLGRPLSPVLVDGRSDAAAFAAGAERLLTRDQVATIFGCWTSQSRKAVLPVVERHNGLLWYPVQYEGQESSPNIIYTGATPNQQIFPALEWGLNTYGPKVYLVGSDYVFPRTANKLVRQYVEGRGAAVLGEDYRPLGARDFDAVVADIQKERPDFVLNTLNGDSNIAFFRALHAAGLKAADLPVFSFSIAEGEVQAIGTDLLRGHYCAWNYFQSLDNPVNRRFVRAFKERYGRDRVLSDPMEAMYFQIYFFAQAAEKAGSLAVDEVRAAALGSTFHAPEGLVRIDPQNQHTWKVTRIGKIQADGQLRTVWMSNDPIKPLPYVVP